MCETPALRPAAHFPLRLRPRTFPVVGIPFGYPLPADSLVMCKDKKVVIVGFSDDDLWTEKSELLSVVIRSAYKRIPPLSWQLHSAKPDNMSRLHQIDPYARETE